MLIDGSTPVIPTKIVTIGHEAVGEIVSFGSQVTGFEKGDLIGFINAYHACWKCPGCAVHYLFCEAGTMQMQGYSLNGFLQEYCTIDYTTATILPTGMDASKAAPLCCAGITAYHAVQNARLERNRWLAVVGCGGLGQMGIYLFTDFLANPE
jgi:D-arabinose 1-dehydrogenase-like Zn-dependent alcohol dehydrogenase